MPALTSPRQYPYPLDGDPINVAGDIQKLAVKIDDDVTAVVATEATNGAKKYDKVGGAITGNVSISGTTLMSNVLTVNPPGDLCIRLRGANPYIDFYNEAGSSRNGYLKSTPTAFTMSSDGPSLTFANDAAGGDQTAVERMRLESTSVLIGKVKSDLNNAGIEFNAVGSATEGRCSITTASSSALGNLLLRHVPAADAANSVFIRMEHSLAGTLCGQIRQLSVAANNTNFDAGAAGTHTSTSDYRLKDELGDVEDPVGKLMQLKPKHLRWKSDGTEFDGFIAHEVAPIVPGAVVGEKDAVLPDDDPSDPGGIDPQALDPGKLVPLLTAALQEALTRIAALEGRQK